MINTWGTWDGRVMKFDRLTWQHLSNIFYYVTYTMRSSYNLKVRRTVMNTLYRKHGGVLPYHPDVRFEGERLRLLELGYLQPNGDIVVEGEKIGWYE